MYIYNHVLCVYHHSRSKSTAQFRFPFVEWCLFRIAPFFQIKNKNVKTLNYWKIFLDSSLSMSKWYVKIIQGIWWWKKIREKPKFFALVTFTRQNLAILIAAAAAPQSCSSDKLRSYPQYLCWTIKRLGKVSCSKYQKYTKVFRIAPVPNSPPPTLWKVGLIIRVNLYLISFASTL